MSEYATEILKKRVDGFLTSMKSFVLEKKVILNTREKNNIIREYYPEFGISLTKILLELDILDFVALKITDDSEYLNSELFIFGVENNKYLNQPFEIYIKWGYKNDFCEIISFHPAEMPIKYAFK